ncbi:hypothetical protein SAMN05421847_0372 [Halpernia humi]|uniref:Uncharacterized protein n=1 Tax=Halpernia humi TaxID=493375 RepID=A0A1H5T7A2_9FLAO|nr:hypothetical protein SAMN05421847_0372 [Halpernia humi]
MPQIFKLYIGLIAFLISILLFVYGEGEILSFLRGFLLAVGIVFIVRYFLEKIKK